MKPIKMICMHDENGDIRPHRFQIETDNQEKVTYQVQSIVHKEAKKGFRNGWMKFRCLCPKDNIRYAFDFTFITEECRWYLTGWGRGR